MRNRLLFSRFLSAFLKRVRERYYYSDEDDWSGEDWGGEEEEDFEYEYVDEEEEGEEGGSECDGDFRK